MNWYLFLENLNFLVLQYWNMLQLDLVLRLYYILCYLNKNVLWLKKPRLKWVSCMCSKAVSQPHCSVIKHFLFIKGNFRKCFAKWFFFQRVQKTTSSISGLKFVKFTAKTYLKAFLKYHRLFSLFFLFVCPTSFYGSRGQCAFNAIYFFLLS